MSWINLAANRHKLRAQAQMDVEQCQRNSGVLRMLGAIPALRAAMAGEHELFSQLLPLSMAVLESWVGKDDHAVQTSLFDGVLNLACIAQLGGSDQTALFERLAALPADRFELFRKSGKLAQQQQLLVKQLVGDPAATTARKARPGQLHSETGWLKALAARPIEQLFSMATCPDHQLWPALLPHVVLPLALLLAKHNPALDPFELLCLGAYPEKHRDVRYERSQPRAAWLTAPDPADRTTRAGFDAIELAGPELRIYHYLGFSWQAALLFEGPQLNAFDFLEQLDLSWRLVEETLSPAAWQALDQLRQTMPCVHVVVHDRTASRYLPAHMERAAAHYGVSLRALDVLEL